MDSLSAKIAVFTAWVLSMIAFTQIKDEWDKMNGFQHFGWIGLVVVLLIGTYSLLGDYVERKIQGVLATRRYRRLEMERQRLSVSAASVAFLFSNIPKWLEECVIEYQFFPSGADQPTDFPFRTPIQGSNPVIFKHYNKSDIPTGAYRLIWSIYKNDGKSIEKHGEFDSRRT